MPSLFGAALLYGDGMITPAVTVLSAIEGLKVDAHWLEPLVIPITIAILVGVFAVQHRGTARVGRLFGPITLLWFFVLGVLGIAQIARTSRDPRRGQPDLQRELLARESARRCAGSRVGVPVVTAPRRRGSGSSTPRRARSARSTCRRAAPR
jgi:hypothetical protein